jgi:hypothetical protein
MVKYLKLKILKKITISALIIKKKLNVMACLGYFKHFRVLNANLPAGKIAL